MTERRRRRLSWFEHGVHAIACVVSPRPPEEEYLCPLCLSFFTREQLDDGVLTDEHVPPRGVGGQPLVLTCMSCNSRSSGLFDRTMTDEEKRRTFGTPYSLGSLPASVTFEGTRNNGSVQFDGKTWVMHSDPGQNNPAALAAYTALQERRGPGSVFKLRLPIKVRPRRAALGWMRSAYLAAFAVYGYRYVLQPAFEPLRAAIAHPDSAAFDPIVLQVPADGALDPLIAELAEPASLAGCRVVVFGPRLILLPPWGVSWDWFATLPAGLTAEAGFKLAFVSVIGRRFPAYPMHLTDG